MGEELLLELCLKMLKQLHLQSQMLKKAHRERIETGKNRKNLSKFDLLDVETTFFN